MAVERAIVIIILSFIGLIIILFLILYFYNYPRKYADYFNLTKQVEKVSILPFTLYKRKRGDTMSFFIFLILAIVVIIAVVMLYFLSYKEIISIDIGNKTEGLLNITEGI